MRAVIATLRQAARSYAAQPPLRRELLLLLGLLLFALLILPTLVWLAGQVFLGDYLRSPAGGTGGPLALTIDFVGGLFSGSPGYWLMLLGPYLLVSAWRLGARLLKM
jgi:hypothetical protein